MLCYCKEGTVMSSKVSAVGELFYGKEGTVTRSNVSGLGELFYIF